MCDCDGTYTAYTNKVRKHKSNYNAMLPTEHKRGYCVHCDHVVFFAHQDSELYQAALVVKELGFRPPRGARRDSPTWKVPPPKRGQKVPIIPGERFHRLTVVKEIEKKDDKRIALCDCICGTKNVPVRINRLRSGTTRSCGCLAIEMKLAFMQMKPTRTKAAPRLDLVK
jgi:hypothetical protein